MPIKEVNLSGTLNLQDDEYAIGLNGFVELVNLRQQNGKLVQRYGTGSPATLSSKNIDNMEIFVDRRLQAVTIDSSSSNYTFAASAKTLTLSATTGVTIPGSTSKDWTTVFKAGDSIYINSISADNDGIFTIASITSTVMTFENAPTDEGAISSGTITLGFAFADFNDTAPSHITAADANSFDGRAWITSYTNTNKFLSLVSPLDYTDNIDLEDFGTGTGDMHIRPKAYTDAVRIACGLDHSPRIFKYINRHHFNGIMKGVYNSYADLLYPRWVIDTATPALMSVLLQEATSVEELATYGTDHTPKNPKYILGSLNMLENNYKWSFVPVYDGNQEGLLEEPLMEFSSTRFKSIGQRDMAIINKDTACMYSRIRFTLSSINPRLSGVNVYRSTNGGTPYKIKSIYAGDNDVTQKTITTGYNQNDRVLWSGGTINWGSSGNSNIGTGNLSVGTSPYVMIDGREYDIADDTGWNNYRGTGYYSVELTEAVTTVGTPGNSFHPSNYGDIKRCKFNHISKDTNPIIGGNDSYAGGSPNGGWYFASQSSLAATTPTITDQTGYDGGMANDSDNDFHEEGPFGDNASTGIDMRIANPGDSKNDAGVRFTLASLQSQAGGDYVVSGWIRAKNLNSSSSSMNFYLNTTSAEASNGPGS